MKTRITTKVMINALIIISIFAIFGLSSYHGIVDWTTPKIEDTKIKTNSTKKEVIAEKLMVEYLSKYE